MDTNRLAEAVLAGDRVALARAITLAESRREADRHEAAHLLRRLAPHAGGSLRLAVSGPPGVGKSTLIDALGRLLCERGRRVAVLAVDPSSRVSGGSVLGDKTRMAGLAARPEAFIRPSPSGGGLGGLARGTREALLLCEAAGFQVVLLETVGTGQGEAQARDLSDVFLLLVQPGAGDGLQGIKRGAAELADILAVSKADGELREAALRAVAESGAALALSARTGEGLEALWELVEVRQAALVADGGLEALRRGQEARWFRARLDEAVLERVFADPRLAAERRRLEAEVEAGALPAEAALQKLLALWEADRRGRRG